MSFRLPLLLGLALGGLAAPALPSGTLVFECEFAADSSKPIEQVRFLLDSKRRKAYRETSRGNVEIGYRVDAADTAVAFFEEGAVLTRVDASWSSTRAAGDRVRDGFCRVR